MSSKRCTRCGREQPLDQFWPRRERQGSHTSHCKPCRREAGRLKYRCQDEVEWRKEVRSIRANRRTTLDIRYTITDKGRELLENAKK